MSDLEFRDFDPEDVYDATDRIGDRLEVLERIVEHLRDNRDHRFDVRRLDLRRLLDNLDREDLSRREARRLRRIRDDEEEL